jgi:5S rRNA maturation endonuclease (ribonuclease M5)
MTGEKRGYIDVDNLQRELAAGGDVVERIATFYHRSLPALHRTQDETRLACHFACSRDGMTGDRAISVKTQSDGALFRCFHYGCTVRGNLLTLMYWMKHNHAPSGERLKGPEFREIAEDLQALVRGDSRPQGGEKPATDEPAAEIIAATPVNVPLKDSENERARELVTLDEKFITDVAQMNPKAAAYVRRRPFMTPEMMRKFHCGYLPNDAGSLLRGHFVYGWTDANGDILTWFGRNLNFEEQHAKWQRSGDSKDEPSKFRFVKGFHRGLELFGENIFRREASDFTKKTGVILVEGPNDVMNLNALGVPAVAVCSNTVTDEQAEKLAALSREFGNGTVSVMFDLDREGENGAKQAILALAGRCRVRNIWTSELAGGKFNGRQPE